MAVYGLIAVRRGMNFENAVKLLLQTYLGSRFDFYNKAQILDANLNYLRIFEGESSELDIVATFKNASPNIVAKLEDSYYVPYDAVAFYIEVKKISELGTGRRRFSKIRKTEQVGG